MGVAFVSLQEGIDATTSAGKLQMHTLGAIAEFERARIAERVNAGLSRARANGRRFGRPRLVVGEAVLASVRERACEGPQGSSAYPQRRRTGACGRSDSRKFLLKANRFRIEGSKLQLLSPRPAHRKKSTRRMMRGDRRPYD